MNRQDAKTAEKVKFKLNFRDPKEDGERLSIDPEWNGAGLRLLLIRVFPALAPCLGAYCP
jgi:hypothetical protein